MSVSIELDHLVVAAATLEDGVAWCERELGFTPTAGGQHLFMGTHNRVFNIASPAFPRSYLEIIAIDPSVPAPSHPRWFDLDDAALQQRLRQHGPQLAHWVARCADVEAAGAAMRDLGVDAGAVMPAQRGALRWRVTIRPDGRRQLHGAAPALIEWGDVHPTDGMPASGVQLESFAVAAPTLAALIAAPVGSAGSAPLQAVLSTPRGRVVLAPT